MTSHNKDLTSQHKDLIRQHKDLTSQHNYLTSNGINTPTYIFTKTEHCHSYDINVMNILQCDMHFHVIIILINHASLLVSSVHDEIAYMY